jgi:hypothetical protein
MAQKGNGKGLAANLLRLRKAAGLTQAALADRRGFTSCGSANSNGGW